MFASAPCLLSIVARGGLALIVVLNGLDLGDSFLFEVILSTNGSLCVLAFATPLLVIGIRQLK